MQEEILPPGNPKQRLGVVSQSNDKNTESALQKQGRYEQMSESDTKQGMIAQIAAAYASRPDVSADDIIALVGRLTQALDPEAEAAALLNETSPTPATAATAPAIPVEQAITQDKVYCLCCGKGFKMLKRHLGSEHGLTEAEYRAMFNLPEDMPLVAPSYSKRKADYAKQAGFGKYARQAPDRGAASRQKAD